MGRNIESNPAERGRPARNHHSGAAMTVLDRAFIKAFQAPVDDGKHEASPHVRRAHAPAAAPSVPGKRAIGLADVPDPIHSLAPLSSFAVATKIHDSFRAEHEVDRLTWPPACQKLLSQASRAWSGFADQLIERCGQGHKCRAGPKWRPSFCPSPRHSRIRCQARRVRARCRTSTFLYQSTRHALQ